MPQSARTRRRILKEDIMINFRRIKKQLFAFSLIFLIIFSVVFVLGAETAQADNFVVVGLKSVLARILLSVQEMIGFLAAWLAGLAQGVLNFADYQNAQMVQDGWKISRDLVNMFFVMVLLAIAFATILRFETYGMKALLPKLIIAALLINFSLVFAGVIIDFAGVLTDFFITDSNKFFKDLAGQMGLPKLAATTAQQDTGEYWQCESNPAGSGVIISGEFKTASSCQAVCLGAMSNCVGITPDKVNWGKIAKGDEYWKIASALFLSIIFTLIAAFVFGALAVLLLIRVVIIWFLLILAPIAWFFWILPATRHLFNQWWNAFIKWVMFAPAAIFFIWLSVNSWLKFIQGEAEAPGGKIAQGMKEVITSEVLESKILPQVMAPGNFVQFIIACGMLLGSLIVAQKMGVYGASGAMGIAKSLGKGTAKWTGKFGKRALMKMAPPPRETPDKKLKRGWVQRGLAKIAKIPLAGKLAVPALRGLEQSRAVVNQEKENIKGWSSGNLVNTFDRVPAEKKVARMLQLYENDDLDKLSEKQREEGLKLAQRYGQESKPAKALPSLAEKIGKDIQGVINSIKPDQATKIVPGQLEDERVQKAVTEAFRTGHWTSAHLGKIGSESPALRTKIQKRIMTKANVKTFPEPIRGYLGTDLGKSLYGLETGPTIEIVSPVGAGGRKISEETLAEAKEALKK